MASETVVVDSNNLEAIIAEATDQPLPKAEEPKVEAKEEPKPEKGEPPNGKRGPEHVGEDGLTEEERKTFTEKMRKSIAWRTGRMKEAEESARQERQGRLAAEERAKAAEEALTKVQPRIAAPEGPQEPKRDGFETDEAFQAALIDYRVEQRFAKERAEREKQARDAEVQEVERKAAQRIAEVKKLVPDFEETVNALGEDFKVPDHIFYYMKQSDLVAELGYHFAQHPDILEPLTRMPVKTVGDAMRLGVALGKIESTLQPFGHGAKPSPKVEASGASPKPSTAADGNPSRPRVSVPVVQPLSTRGAPEVEPQEVNGRQAVTSFEKRTGANLMKRARH